MMGNQLVLKDAEPFNKEPLGTVCGQLDALPPTGGLETDYSVFDRPQHTNNRILTG